MSLVALSSQSFGGHARALRTRRGLKDVEEIEADRLLDFDGRAPRELWPDISHMNVAAMPEVVQKPSLRGEQCLNAIGRDAIHRPLSTAAEFLNRCSMSGMIDHVFVEVHRTVTAG